MELLSNTRAEVIRLIMLAAIEKMKHLTVFILCLLSVQAFGQKHTNKKIERELEIQQDYYERYAKLVNKTYHDIKDHILPIPYFIGDEFVLSDTLLITTFLREDGALEFANRENSRSIIPKGYKVKLIKKEGDFYHIRARSEDIVDVRNEIISEEYLLSYFDPRYISTKARLYYDMESIEKQVINKLSDKYKISIEEITRIVKTYYAYKQNPQK